MTKRTFEFVDINEVESNKLKLAQVPKISLVSNQPILIRKCNSINRVIANNLPSTNGDLLEVLTNILQGQREINTRLEKIEQTQTSIINNQNLLSNAQDAIVANQQQIANKLEDIETSIMSKPEMMAQSRVLVQRQVAIKKVNKSVCPMTDEINEKTLNELDNMLPMATLEAVEELEEKLSNRKFAQTMKTYLHKFKGESDGVNSVIRELFTDDLLEMFNWEGRWGRKALAKLYLIENVLRGVFQEQRALDFEKNIKRAVERSHHRVKQKNYKLKKGN
ncbi:uncharacterized protein LOC119600508 isoform X2 [Lucilia sericata]|uniref:uncharacterized protein LOC119600508 isoform X2 n=1 Tax=Lucilia sericata TaxID=13632 RepID=UPI0018A863D6|nr:uncharacterized protein LOC119600508 isoform X2 [Lucilia sericata]